MLTIEDIKGKEFKKTTLRGYNIEEVDNFFAEVIKIMDTMDQEVKDAKIHALNLSDSLQYYKSMEQTIQNALVSAEKVAQETKDTATEQSKTMIDMAIEEAKQIKDEAETTASTLLEEAYKKEKIIKEASLESLQRSKEELIKVTHIYKEFKEKAMTHISEQLTKVQNDSEITKIEERIKTMAWDNCDEEKESTDTVYEEASFITNNKLEEVPYDEMEVKKVAGDINTLINDAMNELDIEIS
ncbi:MAG: hypothetical protein BEN19_01745 [Epulopiscium sp. Nuni2H_MBin003]|nr:MAG: hypothetical protein BEN19_01745 [Epulopiscium sp. Nuni2H_MBin003]